MNDIIAAAHFPKNQWEVKPSEVARVLADEDGKTYGYGYGAGWSLVFGYRGGDLTVQPGQWVVRYRDGSVGVLDALPEGVREELGV